MTEPQQSLSDAVAAISTLPNEILQYIFGIVVHGQRLDDYEPYKERFPLRLTRVCRTWESLALAVPSLWTAILIKYDGDVSSAPLFINRADPCSFGIHIEAGGLSLRDFETIGRVLVTYASRLRTLKVMHFTDHEAEKFTNLLSQTAWPALEVVDITSNTCIMDNVVAFVSKLNRLRSLTLKGSFRDFQTSSPPWSNLTFLNVRKLQPRLAQLQELFASAPQLNTLYLPCLERITELDELGEVVNRSVIDASSLRTLSVGMGHGDDDICTCPLSYLRMPNLETLFVNGIVCRTVGRHFSRSEMADSLTTLRLSHMDMTLSDAAFYRTLHNVRRLELIATNDAELLSQPAVLAQQAASPTPPFPFLTSIAYFPDAREDISWLGYLTQEMAPDRSPVLVEVLRDYYAKDLPNELPPKTNLVLCTDPPGADFPLDEDDPFEMAPSEWSSEDDAFVDYEYDHDWYYSDGEEWYGQGDDDEFDDDEGGLEDIMGPWE